MPMQEFLASYAVEVDESGAKKLQEILKSNRELAESLAGAFDAARTALDSLDASMDDLDVRAALNEKLSLSDLPTLDLKAALDLTEASASAETWIAQLEALRPKLKANTSGITTAVSSAVSSIRSMLSSLSITVPVRAVVTLDTSGLPSGSSDDPGDSGGERDSSGGITIPAFANGGRVDSPTMAMIGEESEPEYVIPVNREERAVPLVRNLLSEMSEPAKESVLGTEEIRPETKALPDEEPIPSVKEFFSSPESVPPVKDHLNNNDDTMEDTTVSDLESVPQMTTVFPEMETFPPVVDIPAESEASQPAVELVSETEPIPLVQKPLPGTEPTLPITESLPEMEMIPTVQEMLPVSKAVPPVRKSIFVSETVPPVRKSLPEPEAVLPEKEQWPEANLIPNIKESFPETEVIPPVNDAIPVAEEFLPVTEPTMEQTMPVSGKEITDHQAVPAVSVTRTLTDYPAPGSVRDALSEQSTPVPLSEKLSGKQAKPRKALSPMPESKTDSADIIAANLVIPERVTELITSTKEPVPDKTHPVSSSDFFPQQSAITETPKALFQSITDQYANVDLSHLQDAIADLPRMTLPQAPDASFIPSMLHDLTEIARSQFLPAGVSAPTPSHSVEAPVTIQVNSPYASPEEVGRSVYDLTQRYLLRTMKGVFSTAASVG